MCLSPMGRVRTMAPPITHVNVTPLPAAHVDLSGSSSTTLNLMDFATVTGSLSGTSALFYYGTNINLQLTVANSSSITRLGGTR